MKNKTKTKISHNRKELRATGGGPNTLNVLSPLESAVDELLNISKAVDPPGVEFGAGIEANESVIMNLLEDETETHSLQFDEEWLVDGEEMPEPNEASKTVTINKEKRSTRSTRSSENASRIALLEAQTNSQIQFHEEALKEIRNLTSAVKDVASAVRESSCQHSQYMKELIELKKQKLRYKSTSKKY